jgi:hypothetical protein
MSKPRLLLPVSIQFAVRYVLRTGLLSKLSEFAQPVILMAWEDDELKLEFEASGAEVHALPKARFGLAYERVRTQVNLAFQDRLNSPSTPITRQLTEIYRPLPTRLRRQARDVFYRVQRVVENETLLFEKESRLRLEDTNLKEFIACVERLKPDSLLSLTPFLDDESQLDRAALLQQIPACASILSFDNITTRGWIPTFQRYLLWNRYNEAELRRAYPEAVNSPVNIVGAPQFDFYWDETYFWDEDKWQTQLGLPTERPVILFGGASYTIAPNEQEYVLAIDRAIEDRRLPDNPILLVRPHPVDPLERWQPTMRQTKHAVYNTPWASGAKSAAFANIRREDIERLTSTLKYSAVHVNTSSTMTVDGAIFDHPQIGPTYDADKKFNALMRDLYLREHFLPITNSGGLHQTYNAEELILAVKQALIDPSRNHEGRSKLVREICTYTDGKSTVRVAEAVKNFLTG